MSQQSNNSNITHNVLSSRLPKSFGKESVQDGIISFKDVKAYYLVTAASGKGYDRWWHGNS